MIVAEGEIGRFGGAKKCWEEELGVVVVAAAAGVAFDVKCNLLIASVNSEVTAAVGDAFAMLIGFTRFKSAVNHLRFCFFEHLVIA